MERRGAARWFIGPSLPSERRVGKHQAPRHRQDALEAPPPRLQSHTALTEHTGHGIARPYPVPARSPAVPAGSGNCGAVAATLCQSGDRLLHRRQHHRAFTGWACWPMSTNRFPSFVITDVEAGVTVLAELGVIFPCCSSIGIELSFQRLWNMRRLVFGLGSAQILVTGAVIAGIAGLWGNATGTAIILGACLALSSTAIVTQLLVEGGRLGTPSGRATFSILLMQDLAVVPILFAVSVLGSMAIGNVAVGFAVAIGEALLVIVLIYGIGRVGLRPVLRIVSETESREAFVAIVLLIAVGTAALTGFAGLSMALGAFLAGLLIAETEFRHQVKIDIEPFKGLMLGLFFLSVGMGIDWRVVIDDPVWIIASAVGLVLIKVAINFALCLAWRLPRHRAAEVAITLGQAGEFGFLIVGLSVTVGLLPAQTGQFMVIVVGLTMIATPGLDWLARRVGTALERGEPEAGFEETSWSSELGGHVILAGFGRVGRTIANVLDRQDIRYVAIDRDTGLAQRSIAEGRPVRLGDASRLDVLRDAGLDRASAVVVTIGDKEATEALTSENSPACTAPSDLRARARYRPCRKSCSRTGRILPCPKPSRAV